MAYLDGFNNRLKLTIPNDKVDSTLTDFPVMIKLSSSAGLSGFDATPVFDELSDSDKYKIAVTTAVSGTQCPVEIEHWDSTAGEAVLWTKVPSVYSNTDTELYLYYDATTSGNITYVGDTGDAAAQNVWDDNFLGVWHMSQSPVDSTYRILESTGNGHNGRPINMDTGDLVDGKVGKALDFDGANDYVNIDYSPAFQNLSSMTVEGIVATPASMADTQAWFSKQGTSQPFNMYMNTSYQFYAYVQANSTQGITCSTAAGVGEWVYNCLTYDGSNLNIFLNGVKDASPVGLTGNTAGNVSDETIGMRADNALHWGGKVDEVRFSTITRSDSWIKTTYYSAWDELIVYEDENQTTNWLGDWSKRIKFTVDSSKVDSTLHDFPMLVTLASGTGISNQDVTDVFDELSATNSGVIDGYTKLVLPPPGDYSSSGHVITTFGAPDVVKTTTPSGMLGSMYFDGTDDYLRLDDDPDWDFSTGNFTIDFWMYPSSAMSGCCQSVLGQKEGTTYFEVFINASGPSVGFQIYISGTREVYVSSNITLDAWQHFAVVRNGSTFTLYIDGQSKSTDSYSGAAASCNEYLNIGANISQPEDYTGYISELRVSKGIARWTSNFIPSTEPYESDSYTKLLLHFEGDRSGQDHVITFHNAMDLYPPTGSDRDYDFDGSNDYITVPNSVDWDFGTGDFTLAFWSNPLDNGAYTGVMSTMTTDNDGWAVVHYHTADEFRIQAYDGSLHYFAYIPVTYNEWHHYAWVRRSGVIYAYKDGEFVTSSSATHAINNTNNNSLYFGTYYAGSGNYFQGYLSRLEIHKGNAVWEDEFTPPPLSISNEKKIAITIEDGVTQCPVEIEKWDAENEQAWLWTKAPVIYADRNTDFYLYYDSSQVDNSNVGDTGTTPAFDVWDDNFQAVWHMAQDPSTGTSSAVKDSTTNSFHATGVNSPTLVDGKVGKGINLDEPSSEYLNINSQPNIVQGFTDFTLNVIAKVNDWTDNFVFFMTAEDNPAYHQLTFGTYNQSDGTLRVYLADDVQHDFTPTMAITDYAMYTIVRNGSSLSLYENGNHVETVSCATNVLDATPTVGATGVRQAIGAGIGGGTYHMGGVVDHTTLSNVTRSPSWIKASYNSSWNTLLTFNSPTTRPIFVFNGTVKVGDTPVARVVNLYRRSNGELVGTTISHSQTGYFEVGSPYNELHYVIILPDQYDDYDLIAHDKLDPEI